ncbi:hypothetical protein C8Q74DRAFT_1266658 [Fomes fomentarius]|nr:hypothetical protein C8Q74DRAFT_1266658 [Fomes fomentarius]
MPSFASLVALVAPMMRDAATNLLVLKFADVLEQFESEFYKQALGKFQESDFTAAGFVSAQVPIEQFIQIQSDEQAHATALEATIKSMGDSPITDSAHLIDDPVLLTAAGSILTIEARHQTILNVLNSGISIPQAFDVGLLPNEVLAIASAFISGCDLGVPANQPLTVTNTGSVQPGTLLTFQSPAINGSTDGLFCQMLIGGAPSSISLPIDQCVVPEGIEGPVAIFVTSDMQPLNNNVRDRANQPVLAGPTMAFIDTQKQLLSQLALAASGSSGSNNSANDGTSTSTITPPEASSIIASASAASATATGGAAAPTDSATSGSNGASAAAPAAPESDKTVVEQPGTRNVATGPSPDGKITVDGWQQEVPKDQVQA